MIEVSVAWIIIACLVTLIIGLIVGVSISRPNIR